jgi:hypothetical protein
MTLEYLDEASIDTEASVEAVFVLKNAFNTPEGQVQNFSAIERYLGAPIYVGISYATLPEVLCVNVLSSKTDNLILQGPAKVDQTSVYKEYIEVSDYDTEYEVYLHSYHKDGLIYTFVTDQGLDTFYYYYIQSENLADIEQ